MSFTQKSEAKRAILGATPDFEMNGEQVSPIKQVEYDGAQAFFGDFPKDHENFSKAALNTTESIVRPSRKDIIELANQNLQLNKSIT